MSDNVTADRHAVRVKARAGVDRKQIKRETNVELKAKLEPGLYLAKGAILNALSRAGGGKITTPNVIIEIHQP